MSESKEAMEVESLESVPAVACEEVPKQSMEVCEPGKNVMAPGTSGSVTCSLHPLVIMNVSEHWTRARAQNEENGLPQGTGHLQFVRGVLSDWCLQFSEP